MGKKKRPLTRGAGKGQKQQHESAHNLITTASPTPDSPPTDYLNAPAVPNTEAAINFLLDWSPEGPWALTAIKPDKKVIQGELFTKEQFGKLKDWITERNGTFNLYFSVNPLMRAPKKEKAKREDIAAMARLHVDIDARAGEPLEDEVQRIYSLLTVNLPKEVPPPSVIVFSGGGFSVYWKLAEPLPINGEEAAYEDAKLYNKQLEILFGGDNCHNVDRIMRLPGSVNIPNAVKLKKGRKLALATVVQFTDASYPLAMFTKAPAADAAGRARADAPAPDGKATRIASLDELDRYGVEERVKVIIARGYHPDEPPKTPNNSKSEWLYDAACNLFRRGVPEDVVRGIITDPDWGISASVLNKGSASAIAKYAERQIARAKAAVAKDARQPDLTDVGNALRLAQMHSSDLLYCYAKRTWLNYEGGRWREDDGALIARYCKDVVQAIRKEANVVYASMKSTDTEGERAQKEERANELYAFAIKSSKKERIFAIEALARSEVPVQAADLDSDVWLFNVLNGTIDLRTGELQSHDPVNLLCKQAPVEYNPQAECPMFLAFLEAVLPDADLRRFLQRALGYSLCGDISEQAIFIAYGGGANGKSTLFSIVRAAMGDYFHTAQMDAFIRKDRGFGGGPSEELASMVGKRFVQAAETQEGSSLDEQLIKQITGGERMRARFLHQNSFEFDLQLKLWLQVNHLPRVAGTDHGIWRRIRVVPFKRSFSERQQDKRLPEKIIAAELPGVLRYLVEGCLMAQREGLGTCAQVVEETAVYKKEEDVLRAFFDDRCVTGTTFEVPVAWVRSQFYEWCKAHGERPMSSRKFGNEIVSRGYPQRSQKFQGKQQRCYIGFKLSGPTDLRVVREDNAQSEGDAQEGGQGDIPF